jgi:hypothetical protein
MPIASCASWVRIVTAVVDRCQDRPEGCAQRLLEETARKAVAHSMYWTFVALLVGAFCASLAATVGGKQRDRVVVV